MEVKIKNETEIDLEYSVFLGIYLSLLLMPLMFYIFNQQDIRID